jgi:protein-L-isoaspartate(D-aspartate) O-methyltransferase
MNITILSSRKNPKPTIFAGVFVVLLPSLFFASASRVESQSLTFRDRFVQLRRDMVDQDLRGRGIKDARVLEAMESVPRHFFVPESLQSFAYEDRPLPIGDGQTISQPYIVALMTELLELKGTEKVLEIGTGSGYQAAVLARLARHVFSVEILPSLARRAKKLVDQMGFTNVEIKVGDGFFGWQEYAPFDAILLTASAPKAPEPLWKQLREGGRLVMPLGEPGETQRLVRIKKVSGRPITEEITGVIFVPLTGAIQTPHR